MNTQTLKPLGQIAYEAYCGATQWKSLVSGAALPDWNQVKPEIQAAWNSAANAVAFRNGQGLQPAQRRDAESAEGQPRPRIVCICGSSRFVEYSAVEAWKLNKQGIATFFMPLLPGWYPGVQAHHQAEHEGVATALDNLWLRMIELADAVLVINANNYIGDRTKIEIAHARMLGKPVEYLQPIEGNAQQ